MPLAHWPFAVQGEPLLAPPPSGVDVASTAASATITSPAESSGASMMFASFASRLESASRAASLGGSPVASLAASPVASLAASLTTSPIESGVASAGAGAMHTPELHMSPTSQAFPSQHGSA
jgi:hypothetical protein